MGSKEKRTVAKLVCAGIVILAVAGGVARAAEPVCGDANHPYPVGDLNKDCRVDSYDLAILAAHWLEDNNPVNSNSIVKDGIEYYIQTDKAVYNLGEDVEILYRVTNLRNKDVTFAFNQSPEWNFWVEKDGQHIWRAVNGWWTEMTQFTLGPDDSKEFPAFEPPCVWNMRDDENNLVSAGAYNVIGGLYSGIGDPDYYEYTKVSVLIAVIP